MSDYPFPSWRRLIFLALLIIVLVLALAPSVTKGSINVRVYALLPQGVVKHLYATFTGVQVHVAGLPESSGWSTVSQNPASTNVDLIPQSTQLIPSPILTTSIASGRYDSIRMTFSNSTLVLQSGQRTPMPTGPVNGLSANAAFSIPPNGNGDVLFVLSLDYSQLISTSPSISAEIALVTSF